jgi:arylsulfatase A-like enzyme
MKELGEWDRTLIVVFGDHGEAFGEHATMSHGVSVYQEQVHVPLWIKLAERDEARVVDERVSLVDLLPTVLDALEIAPPEHVQGRSLLRPPSVEKRALFSENASLGQVALSNPRFAAPQRAVFFGRWKLVQRADGEFELYDLATDPEERTPLADAKAPAAIRMAKELAHYLELSE